jgi:Flp pilus assembly pilin Flp
MRKPRAVREFWNRLHNDQDGAVSLETILIIGAIAMPILIFLLKYGWPKIRDYFNNSINTLNQSSDNVIHGN